MNGFGSRATVPLAAPRHARAHGMMQPARLPGVSAQSPIGRARRAPPMLPPGRGAELRRRRRQGSEETGALRVEENVEVSGSSRCDQEVPSPAAGLPQGHGSHPEPAVARPAETAASPPWKTAKPAGAQRDGHASPSACRTDPNSDRVPAHTPCCGGTGVFENRGLCRTSPDTLGFMSAHREMRARAKWIDNGEKFL